jgi:hypothetical protein
MVHVSKLFKIRSPVITSSLCVCMLAGVVYYLDSWSELCIPVLLHQLGTSLGILLIYR